MDHGRRSSHGGHEGGKHKRGATRALSHCFAVSLSHDLVSVLSQVGLIPNANNIVLLTNQAQPPQHLQVPSGGKIAILEHHCSQKTIRR